MKNKTINYIKIVFEKEFEEVCKNKGQYKEDYIKDLLSSYEEFIKIYGEPLDGMIYKHYKERLGIEDE